MNSKSLSKTSPSARALLEGSGREDIVVRALQDCQAAIDAGEAINRQAILTKYPEIREELSACLDGLEWMRRSATSGNSSDAEISDASVMPLATLGDFRIVRELGRGGMGVVYEAEQLSVGRKVALKVLPYAAMLDKRQIARFQNEARAAATLEHPHIVPVYFVGNERGVYYYAMRLIDGRNLAEVMGELRGAQDDDAPLSHIASQLTNRSVASVEVPTEEVAKAKTVQEQTNSGSTHFTSDDGERRGVYFESVARLGVQMAEALEYAHSHGIIHRDVKPANIMLDSLGDAWITDFGLARIESDAGMTMTGDLVGTLRYMAPEQTLAQRVTVDHRSDVYSLGATLYELLTLSPAFDGEDRASLLHKIAFVDPKLPSKIYPAIPKDLETIVLKTLHKNPEDRYSSAQELAEDLNRFLTHQPVLARRTPISQRIRMWGRRHPAMVGSVALVTAVVLLATAVLGFMMAKHERTLRSQEQETADQITATLGEKEDALDAANANLDEALNAIDQFLVELSGEGGKAMSASGPLRRDLLSSAFDIYEKLEEANQVTPQLERRKLMAIVRATHSERSGAIDRFYQLRTQGLDLNDRLLEADPYDITLVFSKINLLCVADVLPGGVADVKQRLRDVQKLIKDQLEHHSSAESMFESNPDSHSFLAESMVWLLIRSASYDGLPLNDDEWRQIRDVAKALIDQGQGDNLQHQATLASFCASLSQRLGDEDIALEFMRRSTELDETVPQNAELSDLILKKHGTDAAIRFNEEHLRRHELDLIKYPGYDRRWAYSTLQVQLADLLATKDNLESTTTGIEVEMRKQHPLVRRHILAARLFRHLDNKEKELYYYEQAAVTNFGIFPHGGGVDFDAYRLYLAKGDFESAIDVFPADGPDHGQKRRAYAQFKTGDYEAALKTYRKAFDLGPGDTSTITWITPNQQGPDPGFEEETWIVGHQALLNHMVERYTELIGSDNSNGVYWHGRSVAKRLLGQHKAALEDALRAAELKPGNAMLHNNISWELATSHIAEARDGALAVELATKACALTEWKNVGFLDTLAAAYAESGDFAAAVKWQAKAIELAPANVKEELKSRLDLYEQEKPFHEGG